ncbi:MAG: hypothetical protein EPN20_20390 [Magnetospirillum sp.]|nr:MAG: hypothetical protein EPN20_20390 [Magnetospirillum sp.]
MAVGFNGGKTKHGSAEVINAASDPLAGETLRLLAFPDGVPLFEPDVLVLRHQPSPPSESGAGKSP